MSSREPSSAFGAPGASRRLPAVFLAYFALQVAIPLYSMLLPREDVSGDFSWDMFSRRMTCDALSASLELPNGAVKPLRLDRAFESPQLRRLLHRPRLEHFARYVCDGFSARHDGPVALFLRADCRYERDAATVALADPSRNYCADP